MNSDRSVDNNKSHSHSEVNHASYQLRDGKTVVYILYKPCNGYWAHSRGTGDMTLSNIFICWLDQDPKKGGWGI